VELADAVRAMERSAEAEKAGPENEATDTKNHVDLPIERSEPTKSGRRPLGDGRGQASGMGGGFWGSRPGPMTNSAKRLRWREGCLRAGAVTATRRGQERAAVGMFSRRGAVSVTGKQRYGRQRHIVRPFIPRWRVPQAGGASAIRIKVGERHERPNAQYVLSAAPEAKPAPSLGTE
jgi:hypothetical protein